jgi:hypothetical protein
MFQTSSAHLPADQRQRLHDDFLADEQAYLRLRDSLLPRYSGQWVAVHHGQVVASGPELLSVLEQAALVGGHPYVALVGGENQTVFRVRRSTPISRTNVIPARASAERIL